MHILITGAQGFIGKNLTHTLTLNKDHTLLLCDKETSEEALDSFIKQAEFVIHLAGVNRPKNTAEFTEGNVIFTEELLDKLARQPRHIPVLLASSTQAALDNPYGQSKRHAEALVKAYGEKTDSNVYVYRFPNVFGKWSRPNYNSAIATFCHNIAHDLDITVNDPNVSLTLVYIDDVIEEMLRVINGKPTLDGDFCKVPITYQKTLKEIVDLLYAFKESRQTRVIPNMSDAFTKKLYSTYTSFLPVDGLGYDLVKHTDDRGSFTEFVKSMAGGQVSVNISKPGITKGDHWHHTKNEKFFVVQGTGIIRFRLVDSDEVTEYHVSGAHHQVIDIPVGSTHNIENTGDVDMITLMWVNEPFDPNHPDTMPLEVK